MIGIGPKEKWQADLEKMSRAALIEVVVELQWCSTPRCDGFRQESMGEILDRCKKYGRWANEEARYQRFIADPRKAIDQSIRRSKAAKKAARRHKRRAA